MTRPVRIWRRVPILAIGGGLGFWVANFAISLSPIAAEYRAALSIAYLPMLLEAMLGGFLLLNAVGVGIQCASMIPLISALLQNDVAGHLQTYSAEQLEGLAHLSIDVYKTAFATAQLFFGTWLFPLGYLVFKSGFLPRILGIILMLDGAGIMIWFLQALLLPAYPAISYPSFVLGFIAEVGLALWLLIMAVKVVDAEAVLPG